MTQTQEAKRKRPDYVLDRDGFKVELRTRRGPNPFSRGNGFYSEVDVFRDGEKVGEFDYPWVHAYGDAVAFSEEALDTVKRRLKVPKSPQDEAQELVQEAVPRMLARLDHQAHKHNRPGVWRANWLDGTWNWDKHKPAMRIDLAELELAIEHGATSEDIWDKATDVANMALIAAQSVIATRSLTTEQYKEELENVRRED